MNTLKETKENLKVEMLKGDLLESALNIESLKVLFCDMIENYFESYDTNNNQDRESIIREFYRYRAYAQACLMMIHNAEKNLHDNGICCLKDET